MNKLDNSLRATKYESYGNGCYSVLVRDDEFDISTWVDVSIDEAYQDVNAEWNAYIFHLAYEDDVALMNYQNDCDNYDRVTSIAIEYLEAIGKIHQDDNGNWHNGKAEAHS